MIRQVKSVIKKHGYVHVAYHLKQKDTWTLKSWVKRNEIPDVWKDRVKLFLKEKK